MSSPTARAGDVAHFDLVILGTGSANSIPGPEFDDWNIAIVERGVFGGTCLNVGCIPSKMFVYAADVATTIRQADRYGLSASLSGVDWPGIRDRVFGRIDPIAAGGQAYRTGPECPNVTVFAGSGRFVGERTIEVVSPVDVNPVDENPVGTNPVIAGRHVVIGTGARPFIPPFRGLDDPAIGYHTSDTIMRLDALPQHLIVLGGGFIACELGYVFAALGSRVTIINRSDVLLRQEDDDIAVRYTELMREVADCRLGVDVTDVSRSGDEVTVRVMRDHTTEQITGNTLLVATGRVPNGDQLNLTSTGVNAEGGRVLTDEFFRTNVEGIWAFGDASSRDQLKHLANAQVRALRHNLLVAEGLDEPMRSVDERFLPHAVFTHPQVAAVGLTERDAAEQGIDYVSATVSFGDTAYGWAMEDTTSVVKLIANRATNQLIGAHIMGPQAPTLISQLIGAMSAGTDIATQARGMFYIHPALTEVVENCLLDLAEQLAP